MALASYYDVVRSKKKCIHVYYYEYQSLSGQCRPISQIHKTNSFPFLKQISCFIRFYIIFNRLKTNIFMERDVWNILYIDI